MPNDFAVFSACRGGWPAPLKAGGSNAKLMIARDYVQSVCKTDIPKIDNVQRNENLARMILRSHARNISTTTKKTTMLTIFLTFQKVENTVSILSVFVGA